MRPTSGDAVVCGFDVRSHSTDVRRNVGVVLGFAVVLSVAGIILSWRLSK